MAANVLAPYIVETWYQRHRRLCLSLLGMVCFVYGVAWALFGQYVLPFLVVPILPFVALLFWLLPDTGKANETRLAQGLFVFVFALLCWPDYMAFSIPGLPWITLQRLVGVPLVLLYLWSLSTSHDYRQRTVAVLSASKTLLWLMIGYILISLISVAFSNQPFFSFQKFMIAQLNWTALFFLACTVFLLPNAVNRLAASLWAITVFVCLIGIWEGRLGRLPWVGHIPSFLAIQDEAVQKVLEGTSRAGTDRYRVQSKFSTSLGLGEFLAISTPFILHYAVKATDLRLRAAAIVTVPLIAWTIYLTDSRLAAIGMLASLALYALFHGVSRWQRDRNDILGSMILYGYPMLFSAMFAATLLIGRLRVKVWGDGSQQPSNDARQTMYENGIPMVLQQPWGHGFGMGGYTLDYRTPGGMLTIDTYYLLVALELGVIGFLVYFAMFGFAIWQASRIVLGRPDGEFEWLGPIAIALFNFVLIKSVFASTENHSLIFVLLGVVVALSYRWSHAKSAPPSFPEMAARPSGSPSLSPR